MSTNRISVLLIGAFPPPYIGPNIAMQNLVNSDSIRRAFDLHILDISDRRDAANVGKLDLRNIYLAIVHFVRFIVILFLKNPQVVHISISQGLWGYFRDLQFVIPAIIVKKRVLVHLRGSEFREFFLHMPFWLRQITQFTFRRVSRVIVLGNNLRSNFDGLVDPKKICVIHNGIDANIYSGGSSRHSEFYRGSSRVLFLSSLRKRKGIFEFLEAVPIVLSRHSNTRFTIAGAWRSEAEKRKGLGILGSEVASGAVDFVGEVFGPRKISLYQEQDMFVFTPTEPEGLPWVILEAMSSALPVITTDRGAISEVVDNGVTGFMVEPEPDQIAEKICYFIENPEIARDFGANGRRRAVEKFSEDTYHREFIEAIKCAAEERL